jgi:hypothetical protein
VLLIGRLISSLSMRRHKVLPKYTLVRLVVSREALGQCFLRGLQFCHVSIIPPVLFTHISFILHRPYIIFVNDNVVKYNTFLFVCFSLPPSLPPLPLSLSFFLSLSLSLSLLILICEIKRKVFC